MNLGLGAFPLMLLTASLPSSEAATMRLPAVFSDHMCLQAGKPLKVWGWDKPGTELSLGLDGSSAKAKAGADGRWSAELPAHKAGGPYELKVSGSSQVLIKDVLVGEVWLGSGQSNMEWAVRDSHDAAAQIPKAAYSHIRLFKVEHLVSDKPLNDLKGRWVLCSPENVKDFSAVAYYFGKELHAALKHPVGLIASAWGGTPAEDWVRREDLDAVPAFAELARKWGAEPSRISPWTEGMPYDLSISSLRFIPKDPKAKPLEFEFSASNFSCNQGPDSSGAVKPGGKSARYSGKVMGGGWGSATLSFGAGKTIALSAYEAVEFKAKGRGQFMLSLAQPSITDFDYPVSRDFHPKAAGETLRFNLADFKQSGWGAPKPLTLDQISSLSFGLRTPWWPEYPSCLYNAMIAPMAGYAMRGVLWYQGESNAGRPAEYEPLLKTLAACWRREWKDEGLHWLVVQLPLYMKACQQPCESDWARLRESQRLAVQAMPPAELCTIMDLGEAGDIHPKNKSEVGRRLAGLALESAYGRKADAAGPRFSKLEAKGGALIAAFTRGAGKLKLKGASLEGFEVAGADGKFYKAAAKISGMSVTASASEVPDPRRMRYAWADNPSGNLWGGNGLPATPFQAELP